MSNRLNIPEVAELLAERTGRKREEAERFLRLLVEAITECVLQDQLVKVKGVGTFKLIEVEARESVHVHTGNRFLIPAHYKFSFTPDKELREAVNRPFSAFETTEILNPVVGEGLEEEVVSPVSEPEKGNVEESVEEWVPDREISLLKQETKPEEPSALLVNQEGSKPQTAIGEERSVWAWLRYVAVALLLVVVAGVFYFMGRNAAYRALQMASVSEVKPEQPVTPLKEEPADSLQVASQEEPLMEPEPVVEESVKPVAEEPAKPKEEPVNKVVIKRGDRLTNIALKHYGHKLFWVYIYQRNEALIADPNNVPIGTELILPPPQQYGINAKSRASLEAAAALQTEILTRK